MGISQNFHFRQRVSLKVNRHISVILHTIYLEICKKQPCLQITSSLNPESIQRDSKRWTQFRTSVFPELRESST